MEEAGWVISSGDENEKSMDERLKNIIEWKSKR
jgi:hypothetical protein